LAHIVEFAVTGLAGRQGVYAQKLNRDINVFFGLNGSGKTSLLKILHYAMRDDASLLQWVPFEEAEVRIHSAYLDDTILRTFQQKRRKTQEPSQLSLVSDPNDPEGGDYVTYATHVFTAEKQPTWKTHAKLPPDFKGRFGHGYLPTSRLFLGARTAYAEWQRSFARGELPSEEQLDNYFARQVDGLWVRYSAEILGAVRKAQADGLANVLKAVITPTAQPAKSEFDPQTAYQRVEAFLRRQGSPGILGTEAEFQSRYATDARLRSVVSDLNNVEQRIEEAMAPRTKLQELIVSLFTGNKRVRFADGAIEVETLTDQKIGLATLSSGEKQVLRIFLEALLAGANSMIVDEPEISMHVDWQRKLLSSMQQLNSQAQLIVATHSPEIMAEIDDSKIFRL
jgi:predicted ATPase